LKGGLDAWEKRGYPVEPLPADFYTSLERLAVAVPEGEYTVRATMAG
jgi:3-mercaptopyruvate sulfurtransferase SseA